MFKKKTLLSFLAVGSLALTACSTNDGETDMDNTTPTVEEQEDTTAEETTSEETEDTTSEYENIIVTPEEAFDIYMDKNPITKIKKVQLDKDLGKYIYKVEGFEANMEYEIKIDSIDGSIIKEHSDTDDDMDEMELTREHVEKVAAIVDDALVESGAEAKIEEWTIEIDDGRVQLEIEIDKKGFDDIEYTYDVETGELIEIDN